VLAPLGTPQPVIDPLRAEIIAALNALEMAANFKALGAEAKFPLPNRSSAPSSPTKTAASPPSSGPPAPRGSKRPRLQRTYCAATDFPRPNAAGR
jgi:hypothetical protein